MARNKTMFCMLLMFLVFTGFVGVSGGNPIPTPASVGGGGGAAVYQINGDEEFLLTECGILDVENGIYELQNDITNNGTCFIIKANNVTLDLNEHSISGNGSGQGVYVRIYDDATIRNGLISNFAEGIKIDNSNDNIIENNAIEYNKHQGIYIFRGENNKIFQNHIQYNTEDYGSAEIELDGSDNNLIEDNHVENGAKFGIQVFSSNNNILKNNHIENNEWLGIDLNVASDNIVENNLIEKNGAYGIYMGGGNNRENKNNEIRGNTLFQNGKGGIRLTSANNSFNVIISNVIDNNYGNGIELLADNENDISKNIIENNAISDNWEAGIFISGAADNTITSNQIERQDYGIYFDASSNTIEANSIKNNEIGIFFEDISESNILSRNYIENNLVGVVLDDNDNQNNLFYNNLFNNPQNFEIEKDSFNSWNTSLESGTNIIGGPYLGGNYWANPDGTGFSQTCEDLDSDGICDSSYELGVDNVDYFPLIYISSDTTPPTINIIMPADGSTIKGDFTSLMVQTNEDAVCEYSLGHSITFPGGGGGASKPIEMEITGENFHMQQIENLEETINNEIQEEKYNIHVTCTDEYGNSNTASIIFYVDLSELREVMILEDIGDYEYVKSSMFDVPEGEDEGVTEMYSAYYDKNDDDYIYSAGVLEVQDDSYFDEFLDEFDEWISITIEEINGNVVYRLDEGDGDYGIFWFHGNSMVYILAAIHPGDGTISETPLPIVEAYLEKYPSDLFIDENPPVITLIRPSDDYVKKTKKSSYDIDFKYRVSDESEIQSCSLIIDGKVEETKTNIQKNIENIFSINLNRGNYDWQIKCMDSEGNEGFSEIRDLRIKKKRSSSSKGYSLITPIVTTQEISTDETEKESEIIHLNSQLSEENIKLNPEPKEKGFFESIWDWLKGLFGID